VAIDIATSFVPFEDEDARLSAAAATADEPVIFPIGS
jgi:hypothetical protein